MKTKTLKAIRITILSLITLSVAGTIGFCALMNYALAQEEKDRGIGILNCLRLVVSEYSQDARKDGKINIFPVSLETLVKENYLNHGDLDDFEGYAIEIIQPKNTANPSDIILMAHSKHFLFECPLEGEIQVKKL